MGRPLIARVLRGLSYSSASAGAEAAAVSGKRAKRAAKRKGKGAISAKARESLRARRRRARKSRGVATVAEFLEKTRTPETYSIPSFVSLRDLLSEDDQFPPDMPYGDVVRGFAKRSVTVPGNEGYGIWDVLSDYPYSHPKEWEQYPPSLEEVRTLAAKERLRYEDLIPDRWASYEANDDDPEEVQARMDAMCEVIYGEDQRPLLIGERRKELLQEEPR